MRKKLFVALIALLFVLNVRDHGVTPFNTLLADDEIWPLLPNESNTLLADDEIWPLLPNESNTLLADDEIWPLIQKEV
ncbi:hypothetical protein LCD52_12885 [Rossellomorea vietnamensis]|uniref:hypothetical protein n=1 Tax=Rossellomorea vietnamensis TaxID=218284 RepID=UPI001CCCB33A|nr:hypothetical protein [Rossellomorea vietnamensis]MCA0149688.1 hypothetical protein [Rossellomorea vietnamensis]